MREIKFRGLAKGRWVFGNLVYWAGNYQIWATESDRETHNYIVNRRSVGMFTGFYDKNNNEIYEGDILSDWVETDKGKKRSHLQVYFNEKIGAWMLDVSFNQDKSIGCLLSDELRDFKYEITSNIYQNDRSK